MKNIALWLLSFLRIRKACSTCLRMVLTRQWIREREGKEKEESTWDPSTPAQGLQASFMVEVYWSLCCLQHSDLNDSMSLLPQCWSKSWRANTHLSPNILTVPEERCAFLCLIERSCFKKGFCLNFRGNVRKSTHIHIKSFFSVVNYYP